jgi:hypothetical protein
MTENYAIQKQETGRELTPSVWRWIHDELAPSLAKARQITVDAAAMKLSLGYEMGLPMNASLTLVQVVQGNVSLSPAGALGLCQKSPVIKTIKMTRLVDKSGAFVGYECFVERADNGFSFTGRWTMDQAKQAGLVKPGSGWVNYPENMCLWRASGFAFDVAAPDVIWGMGGALKQAEAYPVSERGEFVDGTIVIENMAKEPAVDVSGEVARLAELYGVEAVMAAADGGIPTTMEKCAEVEATLQQAFKIEEMENKHE